MAKTVRLYCWQFMAYHYPPADFDRKYDSARVLVELAAGTLVDVLCDARAG